jgi:hypothetical protein
MCLASQESPGGNNLGNLQTFNAPNYRDLDGTCSSGVFYTLGFDKQVWDCNLPSLDECKYQTDYDAFCFRQANPNNPATYDDGNFMDMCSDACHVKKDSSWITFNQYVNDMASDGELHAFCSTSAGNSEQFCRYLNSGALPSNLCYLYDYLPLCVHNNIEGSTCESTQLLLHGVFNPANNICESNTICVGGSSFTDEQGDVCCIGATARCALPSSVNSCADAGGTVKPVTDANYLCPTQPTTINGEQCCIGSDWIARPYLGVSSN